MALTFVGEKGQVCSLSVTIKHQSNKKKQWITFYFDYRRIWASVKHHLLSYFAAAPSKLSGFQFYRSNEVLSSATAPRVSAVSKDSCTPLFLCPCFIILRCSNHSNANSSSWCCTCITALRNDQSDLFLSQLLGWITCQVAALRWACAQLRYAQPVEHRAIF